MHRYRVVLTYTDNTLVTPASVQIAIQRMASTPAMAVSVCSALLGSLLNAKDDDGNLLYPITNVSAQPMDIAVTTETT